MVSDETWRNRIKNTNNPIMINLKPYPLHQRCINYSLENKCCSLLYYNPCGWKLDYYQKICDGRYIPTICAHAVSINLTQNDIDNSRKEVRRIRKELGLS